MANTIIQALQDYLATCPLMADHGFSPMVNYLDETPDSYGIFPLPGEKKVVNYLTSGGIYEFPFSLQVTASNADDLARLQTQGFFELFGKWLDEQDEAENYPILSEGETVIDIEAQGQGYLLDQGNSNVSIYEVPCKMTYERK